LNRAIERPTESLAMIVQLPGIQPEIANVDQFIR
jgi:hypothetical protein